MNTKNLVLGAVFIAVGLVLPIAFHMFGGGGPVFLPMHIPVLLAGLLLGPVNGLIVGVVTPILSSLFTGMPPLLPMLPIMIFELAVYGYVTGYIQKKLQKNVYISLIIAMLLGRITAGLVVFTMVNVFAFNLPNIFIFIWGAIAKGLPGIVIQLVLIPILYKILGQNLDTNQVDYNV